MTPERRLDLRMAPFAVILLISAVLVSSEDWITWGCGALLATVGWLGGYVTMLRTDGPSHADRLLAKYDREDDDA